MRYCSMSMRVHRRFVFALLRRHTPVWPVALAQAGDDLCGKRYNLEERDKLRGLSLGFFREDARHTDSFWRAADLHLPNRTVQIRVHSIEVRY
jgi:hypothetical protein